jgi:uncharacterized membrane protein
MNFKVKIDRCDKMICYNGKIAHYPDGEWSSSSVLPRETCIICGGDWIDMGYVCMRTSAIIAGERIVFCVIKINCGTCGHTDWIRPDPEMICSECGISSRFNLPSSSWASEEWKCNRW